MKKTVKPNLFVIGSMKSGTTYLHELISSHPDIFMSEIKEPCFFVDGEELKKLAPQMWNMGIWENTEKYAQLFEAVEGERIIGESTTLYTEFPTLGGVPKRISDFNPDARFIYVMRDPIARTISHYWHDVKVTSRMEDVLFALISDPHYQHVSNYAMQLQQYLNYFDLDRFYICTFENLIENSEAVVRDIYGWLDIDTQAEIKGLNDPKNVTPESMMVSKANLLSYELKMSPAVSRLVRLVPYRFQKVFARLFKTPVEKSAYDFTEVIEYLRPIQLKQTETLEKMLGRKFPEWTMLYTERQT
jgi:hypothetical protein